MSQPTFDLFVMNVKSMSGSRIDLYVQMPYNRLRFIKTTEGYEAGYSLLIVFRDMSGAAVQTRDVSRSVIVKTYEATLSKTADALLQTFTVPPGRYELQCTSVDKNSHVHFTQNRHVTAVRFTADSIMVSTMMLLQKAPANEEGLVLHPLFPSTMWRARDSMGIFQELYGIRTGDTVSVDIAYHAAPSRNNQEPRTKRTMLPPYSWYLTTGEKRFDSTVYSSRTVFLATHDGMVPLIRLYPVPPEGYSEIEQTVNIKHDRKTHKFTSRMTVFKTQPVGLTFATVVDAMRHIMRESEFDSLRTATDSVREEVINHFWAEHGGQGRRRDYEHGVEEANQLFSVGTEGARTPMGITYIVCGQPEYVDCRPPYSETWYYSADAQSFTIRFYLEPRNPETPFYQVVFNSINEASWKMFIDRWRRQ